MSNAAPDTHALQLESQRLSQERLEERVRYLEEIVRHTTDALEIASSLGDYQTSLNKAHSPLEILQETASRTRRILPLGAVAFFLVDEESAAFFPAYCDPGQTADDMQELFDQLAEERTLAWVLNREQPAIISVAKRKQVIVQPMCTVSRCRGLVLAIPEQVAAEIPASALSLLAIVTLHCANALESYELYKLNRATQQRLEEKVVQLTRAERKLAKQNTRLEALVAANRHEILERKRAQKVLAELNASLETQVAMRTHDLANKAAELEKSNKMLAELDKLKSAFLSSVSHELRTPLTSIRGFAWLILRDFDKLHPASEPPADDHKHLRRVRRNLDIVMRESDRLARLINDLLDLTNIESGKVVWRDGVVGLDEIVRPAVDGLAEVYSAKPEVKLRVELDLGLTPVFVDPEKTRQVLANLLSNAAKFTDAGEVLVTAEPGPPGWMTVIVRDTGVGIAACDQERIFENFHQIAQGDHLANKPVGTGLGLSISRKIVSRYGGSIWVESAPGHGSVFYFTLPLAVWDENDAGC